MRLPKRLSDLGRSREYEIEVTYKRFGAASSVCDSDGILVDEREVAKDRKRKSVDGYI